MALEWEGKKLVHGLPVFIRGGALLIMLCGLLGNAVQAQTAPPEMITDRPDRTESSYVVPRGLWQFELGWGHGEVSVGDQDAMFDQVPETLVRYGVVDRLELRIGWNGIQSQKTGEDRMSGAGDTQLGVKVGLWAERGVVPRAGLLAGVSLPSGSRQFSTRRTDPGFRLALSNDLTERFSLGGNLGVAWETSEEEVGDRDTFPRGLYTLALGISALKKTGFFVEFFGDTALNGSTSAANNIDGGLTYLVRPNVQLDFAVGKGISTESLDWFLTLGVSFRLPH
jgi:hypothetical protein